MRAGTPERELLRNPPTVPAERDGNALSFGLLRNLHDAREETPISTLRPEAVHRPRWLDALQDDRAPARLEALVLVEANYEADPDFHCFADLIAAEGYDARFEGIRYRYLRVDDFLYWASRSLWTPGRTSTDDPRATSKADLSTSRPRSPV